MSIKEISCESVKEILGENETLFIDVRGQDEYSGELGHIPSAKLKTLGEDLEDFKKSLNVKNQKIVFICRSGGRSGKATKLYDESGFGNCHNMVGGMTRWNELGYEVEK